MLCLYKILFHKKMFKKKKINNRISLIVYLLLANGISTPHYCYHNDLSIAGNCRVYLVEFKNSMKPVVFCVIKAKTALSNTTKYYNSALIKKAQENILEFLFVTRDFLIKSVYSDCYIQF